MRKGKMSFAIRLLGGGLLAASIVLTFGVAKKAYGQFPGVPQGHWSKAAVFPQPEEELYGIAAGGKKYVFGGFGHGKPRGKNWQDHRASPHTATIQQHPPPAPHSSPP